MRTLNSEFSLLELCGARLKPYVTSVTNGQDIENILNPTLMPAEGSLAWTCSQNWAGEADYVD